MAKVYSYLRFSRPEQMQGDSERRQVERTAAWADRNGYLLDESLDLRDLGVSAYRNKHAAKGQLSLFLECIACGRVQAGDYLVLENLDRLSRSEVFSDALPLVQQIISAGVSIVTLDPERIYSKESVKEIGTLLEMLLSLYLANEESRKKSERLSEAWKSKRAKLEQRKLTALAPKWLEPIWNEQGQVISFKVVQKRKAIVKRIFELAADGLGYNQITKALNAEEIPTWGKSEFWHRSYIAKILANRSVLGEFQPHARNEDGKRVPIGDPIADYFPRVIEDSLFYSVQADRQMPAQRGRHVERTNNLFAGIVHDARTGHNMVLVDKGKKGSGPQLVANSAQSGKKGSVYFAFPYTAFEQAMLVWAWDLNLGNVLPRKAKNTEKQLAKAEGELSEINHRIGKLKQRALTGDFESLMDLLETLDSEKKDRQDTIERLKVASSGITPDALNQTKELIQNLRTCNGKEVQTLRLKLRSIIRRMVKDICLLAFQVNSQRVAIADIELANGERRSITVYAGEPTDLPEGMQDLDIRSWAEWPKNFQSTRFEIVTSEIQEMIDMEEQGRTRTEIAEHLGYSKTHISRTLNKFSKRKQAQKPADHHWQMTWHAGGNGWTKRHQGRRYFIGMSKLADKFPRLVKERTPEGSWKAANKWWETTVKAAS